MNGRLISMLGFVVIFSSLFGIFVWSWLSDRKGRRVPPRFTDLIQCGASLPGGRIILIASWCWVGWHLLAR